MRLDWEITGETKTQLEKFGDMNGMEILRLLGVKS